MTENNAVTTTTNGITTVPNVMLTAGTTKPAVPAVVAPAEGDKGFPDATPVAEMTDKQAAAYWKFHARKHEDAAKDVPDLKTKAAAWEKYQAEHATDLDKAVAAARAEGEASAAEKANTKAALAILQAGLKARGKDEAAITDLIAAANPAAFITNGDVDTDRVARYVEQIAGPVTGGRPDMGQGRRTAATSSGVSAGRDLYDSTHGKKSA